MPSEFENVFADMGQPGYPSTCTECGLEGANDSMYSHDCVPPDAITLTFTVTVTASRAKLERHLGEESAKELRTGGEVYLNELIPEFDYDSSEIKSLKKG